MTIVSAEIRTNLTTGICTVCDESWEGVDARLPSLQHVKTTGHTVRVSRELIELLKASVWVKDHEHDWVEVAAYSDGVMIRWRCRRCPAEQAAEAVP